MDQSKDNSSNLLNDISPFVPDLHLEGGSSGSRVKFSDVIDEKLFEPRSCEEQFQNLDYFSNAIVSRSDLLQMAETQVGEKPTWTFQDLQALRDLLQQCKK